MCARGARASRAHSSRITRPLVTHNARAARARRARTCTVFMLGLFARPSRIIQCCSYSNPISFLLKNSPGPNTKSEPQSKPQAPSSKIHMKPNPHTQSPNPNPNQSQKPQAPVPKVQAPSARSQGSRSNLQEVTLHKCHGCGSQRGSAGPRKDCNYNYTYTYKHKHNYKHTHTYTYTYTYKCKDKRKCKYKYKYI